MEKEKKVIGLLLEVYKISSSMVQKPYESLELDQVRGLTSWGHQRPLGRPAGIMQNVIKICILRQ